MTLKSTLGQILVNDELPEDMRDYDRVLDKKGIAKLYRELAEKHPDKYLQASHKLNQIGWRSSYYSGGNSFGLEHLSKAVAAKATKLKIEGKLKKILSNDNLNDKQRDELILRAVGPAMQEQQQQIFDESLAEGNPLARQVESGSRGNKMNLASLRGSDLLYVDHRGNTLPVPVLKSYSEGLSPAEYWAGAYGARKGVMDTKFATRDAGFLSKQLNQLTHRLGVTELDDEVEPDNIRGFPVDTDDEDNEGALLAQETLGYPRNTTLTPKILRDLERRGAKRLLLRSPTVGGTQDGGVFARDVGVRERGDLPVIGDNVGLAAAQALSEPLAQAQLSSKHSGGVAGAAAGVSGFDQINQMVQVPKKFKGGAAHSQIDGKVQRIQEAPAGGNYVTINGEQHYVGKDTAVNVKPGQEVEAGDVISEGMPNPSEIVKHKGIGEGRRYFVSSFREAFKGAGLKGNRRNMELLARGLINHVRLTEEMGSHTQDDVIPYQSLERSYQPREGHQVLSPKRAVGRYLEKPVLHYSIGTRIRPSMIKEFQEFGVEDLVTHQDPAPFEPEMIRGMASLQHDPDWMTRMYGSGIKGSLLKGVHRGATSDVGGTSFVPGLSKAVDFGRTGLVRSPKDDINYRTQPVSQGLGNATTDNPTQQDEGMKYSADAYLDPSTGGAIPVGLESLAKQRPRTSTDANFQGSQGAASGTQLKPPPSAPPATSNTQTKPPEPVKLDIPADAGGAKSLGQGAGTPASSYSQSGSRPGSFGNSSSAGAARAGFRPTSSSNNLYSTLNQMGGQPMVQQYLQNAGPIGLPSLLNMNHLATLTQGRSPQQGSQNRGYGGRQHGASDARSRLAQFQEGVGQNVGQPSAYGQSGGDDADGQQPATSEESQGWFSDTMNNQEVGSTAQWLANQTGLTGALNNPYEYATKALPAAMIAGGPSGLVGNMLGQAPMSAALKGVGRTALGGRALGALGMGGGGAAPVGLATRVPAAYGAYAAMQAPYKWSRYALGYDDRAQEQQDQLQRQADPNGWGALGTLGENIADPGYASATLGHEIGPQMFKDLYNVGQADPNKHINMDAKNSTTAGLDAANLKNNQRQLAQTNDETGATHQNRTSELGSFQQRANDSSLQPHEREYAAQSAKRLQETMDKERSDYESSTGNILERGLYNAGQSSLNPLNWSW